MKPVKNKRIRIKKNRWKTIPNPYTHYKCISCGAIDNGIAFWSETRYGSATLIGMDGELGDFDDSDSDNFEISAYRCMNCNRESSSLSSIFVACDAEGNEEDLPENEG